ncbi:MAG: endonuclease/exonuclease/phosphatase family protein [Rhodobacteraceae bacterium]|nr:endonuclease/exonuclease/phosphatase family protein [Paracoccaceae bacterium]
MIRVASYNIHKSVGPDFRRDPARVLDVVADIGADVVALQEVDHRFGQRKSTLPTALLTKKTGLVPVDLTKRPHSLGWHGNAILVREGTKIQERHMLDLPGLEPRGAVIADLEMADTALRVVGVHLALLRRDRRAQSLALARFLISLPPMPTLIMGDFNEWSRQAQNLSALRPDYDIHTPGLSFPARRPVVGLDKFALSRHLSFGDSGVHSRSGARHASDHMPIWADIRAA